MTDCDDYDAIAAWGKAHLAFLRRYLPYEHGVPGGRWLTLLMNRIGPVLFSAAFTAWVRETWPQRPDFVAIDGKTSRRSHDGARTKRRCIWSRRSPRPAGSCSGKRRSGQEQRTSAIPVLLDRLAEGGARRRARLHRRHRHQRQDRDRRSKTRAATICSRSKPISRPCAPRRRELSLPRPHRPRSSTTTRPTAASNSGPSAS